MSIRKMSVLVCENCEEKKILAQELDNHGWITIQKAVVHGVAGRLPKSDFCLIRCVASFFEREPWLNRLPGLGTTEPLYSCTLCNKSYSSRQAVDRHQKRKHTIVLPKPRA